MHPMNKTRTKVFKRIFCIILKNGAPERKTRKVFSGCPQWDGFLEVLSVSDLTFLSLMDVEKQTWNSMGVHQTKWKMVTRRRSRVI